MFWPFKKKNPTVTSKTRKYTPEVIAAKNYLDMTHPTLLPRNSSMASIVGHPPFNYVGSSKKIHTQDITFMKAVIAGLPILYYATKNEKK